MARHLDGPVIGPLLQQMLQMAKDPKTDSIVILPQNEYRALQRAIRNYAYDMNWYPYPLTSSFETVWNFINDTRSHQTDISGICWILDWIYRDPTLPLQYRLPPHNNYLPPRRTLK